MSPGRLAAEKAILAKNFPTFRWSGDGLVVDGTLHTNRGREYRVRLDSLLGYPSAMPRVLVTAPTLYTRDGRPMWEVGTSAKMHTLTPLGTWVQVCHGRGDRWETRDTLYLAVLKARLWLEAYEYHLDTGEPLDRWLSHQ